MRAAVVQMSSSTEREANLQRAIELVREAASHRPTVIALPEHLTYLGPYRGYEKAAETIPGPTTDTLAEEARAAGAYIVAGSIIERAEGGERLYNTSVLITPRGEIGAAYRKIHLFDAVMGGAHYRESSFVTPGGEAVTAQIEDVTAGLTLCYDMRFPELYRLLAVAGAKVVFVPAAFLTPTGKDHWHVLLRARAIENQCFVVAPAQVGRCAPNMPCYGRSIIVDPWGVVLAQAPDRECVISADLDFEMLEETRRKLPALANRRPQAYGDLLGGR